MLRPRLFSRVAFGLVGSPKKEFSGQTKLNAVQHSWFPITTRKSRQINEAPAQIFGIGKSGTRSVDSRCTRTPSSNQTTAGLHVGERGNEVFDDIISVFQPA